MKGVGWRITVSTMSAQGRFPLTIARLFFPAGKYGILQNLAFLMLSLFPIAAVGMLLGG